MPVGRGLSGAPWGRDPRQPCQTGLPHSPPACPMQSQCKKKAPTTRGAQSPICRLHRCVPARLGPMPRRCSTEPQGPRQIPNAELSCGLSVIEWIGSANFVPRCSPPRHSLRLRPAMAQTVRVVTVKFQCRLSAQLCKLFISVFTLSMTLPAFAGRSTAPGPCLWALLCPLASRGTRAHPSSSATSLRPTAQR